MDTYGHVIIQIYGFLTKNRAKIRKNFLFVTREITPLQRLDAFNRH